MLKTEKLDGVLIASPVSSHILFIIYVSEKQIPFLLEKPLSINCEEAITINKKNGGKTIILNMIGYCYRFIDSFREGKKIFDSGCLGNIQRIYARIYISQLFQKGKGWRYDPSISGGGVLTV